MTGDLVLDAAAARLTSGVEAKTQRLRLRLLLRRGEYRLDLRRGVPYSLILGSKNVRLAETILRRAAATSPGIASIEQWSFALDAERVASITLRARSIDGEPIELDDFRWEGQ